MFGWGIESIINSRDQTMSDINLFTLKFVGTTDEYFEILDVDANNYNVLAEPLEGQLSILWFNEDDNQLTIDTKDYTFCKNQIICLTGFHKVAFNKIHSTRCLRFNAPFYCILDHDSEVGCKGVLFFGAANLPILTPGTEDLEILETVWKMIFIEMKSRDNLQLEMLQMMLKRLLILCTRIYKSQENFTAIDTTQVDIVREFNFLVETHFKEKHSVAEYAELLNKSPKTLSNLFGKFVDKTPLQFIQERIMLEVRRLLRYSDKPISEIGYEVGYNDIQSFSRFFKKHQGVSPSEFRKG